MIELQNVTQHYGVRPVLKDVTLQIDSGQIVAVVGPNGMGKSTLLAAMAGVLSPQHGKVKINGLMRRSSEETELTIRRQVVYLPDQPWIPRNRTGREFLLAVGRLYDVEDDRLMDHVDRLLQLFELVRQGDQPIRSYSAGQKKKIALAGALVTEAPILLLDEPFSGGLDPSGILAMKGVLEHFTRRGGATMVITAPSPELVEELAHRVIVLREGRIAAFDTLDGLRRLTNCQGSLAEVLERMIYPETLKNLKHYFERSHA